MYKMVKWFFILLMCITIYVNVDSDIYLKYQSPEAKKIELSRSYAPVIMQHMRNSRISYDQKKAWCDSIIEFTYIYSEQYNVDFVWALALYMQESMFYPKARGTAGDIGLTQITNSAVVEYERVNRTKIDRKTLYNIEVNIRIGLWYLSNKLAQNNENYKVSFAKYNAGKYWDTSGMRYYSQILEKKNIILRTQYDKSVI